MPPSSTNILDLPIEVLWKIFSYLSFDDMKSIELVTTAWHNLLLSPQLWKNKVYKTREDDSDEKIAKTLGSTPFLQSLEIHKEVSHLVFDSLCNSCPLITKLYIVFQTELTYTSLESIVNRCHLIQELHINRLILSRHTLSNLVAQMASLKKLVVDGSVYFEEFIILEPIANGCPNLECLDIRREICAFEELRYFIHKKQDKLKSLAVMWYPEEDGNCVIPLLKFCGKLENLTIFTSSWDLIIPKEAFEAIAMIKSLNQLLIPDLDRNVTVNSEDLICAFENYSLRNLQKLDISYFDGLTDYLVQVICRNCPNLLYLDVTGAKKISDSAFEFVAECKSLQHLCINGCTGLTDATLSYVTKCLKLEELNLNRCKGITVNGLNMLSSLVNLKIVHIRFCNTNGLMLDTLTQNLQRLEWLTLSYSKLVNYTDEFKSFKLSFYCDEPL